MTDAEIAATMRTVARSGAASSVVVLLSAARDHHMDVTRQSRGATHLAHHTALVAVLDALVRIIEEERAS